MTTPAVHRLTVEVPDETYESLRERAARERRSLEEAVVRALETALAGEHSAKDARHAMLSAVNALDVATLWRIVERGAETEEVLLLAALSEKRSREGLSDAEEAAARALVQDHDRAMLLRAKALAVLRERGEDISRYITAA